MIILEDTEKIEMMRIRILGSRGAGLTFLLKSPS